MVKAFGDLTAETPLKYRLAYTADLEATFTPVFKLMLDHDATLFAPGDDRVASLFLWHFVEEVEHRSSALIIYDAVADDPWYRMRVAPSIFNHVWAVLKVACEGFNKHVPLEERQIDAMSMFGMQARKKAAAAKSFRSPRRRTTGRWPTPLPTCRCARRWPPVRYGAQSRSRATIRPTRSCRRWPTSGSSVTRTATRSPSGTPPTRPPTQRVDTADV